MKRLILLLLISLAPVFSQAAWMTNAEENIFGESDAMMVGELKNSKSVILFRCERDDLYFSYIEFVKDATFPSVPAELLFKVDGNSIIKLDATFRVKNANAVEVVSTDKEKILNSLQQLKVAKGKFLVGVNVESVDFKESRTGDVNNSTNAVSQFVTACHIKL
ncbi:hypothetical protein ACIPUA_18205 [Providencia sp. AGC89]